MSDIKHKAIIEWVPEEIADKKSDWKGYVKLKKYGYKAKAQLMRKYPMPLEMDSHKTTADVAGLKEIIADLTLEVISALDLKNEKTGEHFTSVEDALDEGCFNFFESELIGKVYGGDRPSKK